MFVNSGRHYLNRDIHGISAIFRPDSFRTGFISDIIQYNREYNGGSMDISDAVSEYKNSTAITLDVTAGSKKTVFPSGYNEWRNAVQCRIGAQPIEGKANKVILSAVSEFFKVPVGNVSIISGATSSLKRIQVDGISVADAKTLLKDAIAKAKQN